ncbi:MAG: hypothetical protein PHT84_01690 [Candidatus Pacebacteria bacterium]|nr:hypothetical protein [Candidatus Paceibacterota bacterium]
MENQVFVIIFFLLLIDSLGVNLFAWFGNREWYYKYLPVFSKHFPLSKGWAVYYLILVLFIGLILFK